MKERILKNRKLIDILAIVLVCLIIGMPLASFKLDVYYDDGIQHIARAYGTMKSLKEILIKV